MNVYEVLFNYWTDDEDANISDDPRITDDGLVVAAVDAEYAIKKARLIAMSNEPEMELVDKEGTETGVSIKYKDIKIHSVKLQSVLDG